MSHFSLTQIKIDQKSLEETILIHVASREKLFLLSNMIN